MDSLVIHYILSYGGAAGLCLLLLVTRVVLTKWHHREVLAAEREKYAALLRAKDREMAAEQEKNRKLTEANDRLHAAGDIDRATIERLQSSGQLTNQLVGALITIAGENRQAGGHGAQNPPPPQAVTAGSP